MTQNNSKKRTNSTTKRKPKTNQPAKSTISIKQEIVGLVFIAIAIWLFVTVLGMGGKVGNVFSGVLFGLFGIGAYVFPILTICAAVYMMMHGKKSQWIIQTICFVLLFINLCLFLQLLLGEYAEGMKVTSCYTLGKTEHTGGGFVGGLLEWLLRPNFGTIAAYAISIIFIIAMVVVITGRSFFKGVKDSSAAIADKSKEGGRKIKEAIELTEEEREERATRREERHREKEEKKRRTENVRVGVTGDTIVGATTTKTTGNAPVADILTAGNDTKKPGTMVSDDMREIKPEVIPTVEKPVTRSIEKELDGGFFSNTKVETIHAPVVDKTPVYQAYEQESDGQQSFAKATAASVEQTIREAVPVTEPVRETPAKKEKIVLSKEESEKETHAFAKEAEKTETVSTHYQLPPLGLLKKGKGFDNNSSEGADYIRENQYKLERTMESFGVSARVIGVEVGPAVTRYEIQPDVGVKVSKITSLSDDIKLALAASDIRIEAPIPGKSAVGIEVPNKENETIMLRDLLETPEYQNSKCKITFAVGKDISGQAMVADIAKMPHMLIAGATGSGKSVCINTLVMSILFKYRPDQVKMIMIDPKVVELSVYNGIGHLLSPVVSDPKKAAGALNWAVGEMERRYQLFADSNVRDLSGYNDKVRNLPTPDEKHQVLPLIVIIVDELADLMMVASNEVETAICRLAQKARAAGMHLILATQRPSVDVITGLIKANMPSRVAFSVSSGVDSRTILDMNGAERLLGKGDMLFYPQGYSSPKRVQGAFVSDEEVENVVQFLKDKNAALESDSSLTNALEHVTISNGSGGAATAAEDALDELFADAGRFLIDTGKGSIGSLQRRFRIGFNRAARIVDQLSDAGVLGPEEGTKPREILMSAEQFEQYVEEYV